MSVPLVLGAVLLVVVGWLAACAEAGLARVSSFRAADAFRSGRRGSEKLKQVAADPTRYLNLALLVRVACEMSAGVLVTYACLQEFPRTWEALAVAMAVMVLVSYVAIGVSPRTIGRQHPLNTATAAAYVLVPLARVMGPVPQLLILIGNALTPGKGFRMGPFASEAELRAMVDLAEAHGTRTVLGAHVENTARGRDYPIMVRFHTDEAPFTLDVAQLRSLQQLAERAPESGVLRGTPMALYVGNGTRPMLALLARLIGYRLTGRG